MLENSIFVLLFFSTIILCVIINITARRVLSDEFKKLDISWRYKREWTSRVTSSIHAVFKSCASLYCIFVDCGLFTADPHLPPLQSVCSFSYISVTISSAYFIWDVICFIVIDWNLRHFTKQCNELLNSFYDELNSLKVNDYGHSRQYVKERTMEINKMISKLEKSSLQQHKSGGYSIIIHHIVSVTAEVISVRLRMLPLMLSFLQLSELTTPILNHLWIMIQRKKTKTDMYKILRVTLLVLWVILRIICYFVALLLCIFYFDLINSIFPFYACFILLLSISAFLFFNIRWFLLILEQKRKRS